MKSRDIIILLTAVIMGLISFIVFIYKDSGGSVYSESLFEKQERCANNRENAKKQLKDSFSLATPYFYDIFYSPKTDTCVYTYGLILYGTPPEETGSFVIADYFTGEQLFEVSYDNSSDNSDEYSYNTRPQFTEAIEGYKK